MIAIVALLALVVIATGIPWRRRAQEQKRLRMVLLQIRTWLNTDELRDPEIRQWLSGLSAQEADLLTNRLRVYLSSLNWKLNWLFTPELKKAPALQQAVDGGALAYLRAMLASQQLIDDARAYEVYLNLLQRPNDRRHATLQRKLYTTLVAQDLIDPASVRRRPFRRGANRKAQAAAVLNAFERQPEASMQALKTLLLTDGAVLAIGG